MTVVLLICGRFFQDSKVLCLQPCFGTPPPPWWLSGLAVRWQPGCVFHSQKIFITRKNIIFYHFFFSEMENLSSMKLPNLGYPLCLLFRKRWLEPHSPGWGASRLSSPGATLGTGLRLGSVRLQKYQLSCIWPIMQWPITRGKFLPHPTWWTVMPWSPGQTCLVTF